MERKESKERQEELFSPFFTFLRATFFRPFRLSLAPTICSWVSEDDLVGRDEKRAPLKTSAWEATTTAAATRTAKKQ